MCHTLLWYYLILVAVICCISGVVCQDVDNFYCPENPDVYVSNKLISLKNCNITIQMNKLHFTCNVYATSALKLPLFTNTTCGILLTISMETFLDMDEIVRQPSNASCLKFISIRIRKLNAADANLLKKFNKYSSVIAEKAFFPLMLIRQMDVMTVFNSNYAVGIVHYNKSCLQASNNAISGGSIDVSNCIMSTDVVRKFLKSGDKLSFAANATMEELFSKDFLSVSFVVMTKILFEGYNYSIPSAAFQTELFRFLPTEALKILSKKNVIDVMFQSSSVISIRNGDIPLMESLRTLDLKDCKIELIEANSFDGVVHLKNLNLQGNNLKELPSAFQSLSSLNILNLQSNGGSETNEFRYKENVLVTQSDLNSLDLSSMILYEFWENVGTFYKLQYLNLSNCSLDHIPPTSIAHFMPGLIYLNLSNNYLTTIGIHSFSGLNKLKYLDLSKNNLTHVPYDVMINILPGLEFFSLRSNTITYFLPLKLGMNSVLRNLDLSYNRIYFWNTSIISSNHSALVVNLMGNNITEVNSHMIKDLERLKHVQLSENPFDCSSCTMKHFLEWIKLQNSTTDYSRAPYTCFFPKEYFNQVIANAVLQSCKTDVIDWLANGVIPSVVVLALLGVLVCLAVIYRWHFLYFIYLFQSKVHKYRRQDDGMRLFKFDAFVSYCTADRSWVVEHLIPSIENQEPRLHLCVHERDFEVGETIMNNVIECIDSSHKSIFVLTECFIESQWCQWELQMAQHKLFEDKRDVLILIMLGEISKTATPKILKRLISKRTYLQWSVNETSQRLFWKRLKDAIGSCQCIRNYFVLEIPR